jgi:hypothetical protein
MRVKESSNLPHPEEAEGRLEGRTPSAMLRADLLHMRLGARFAFAAAEFVDLPAFGHDRVGVQQAVVA